MTITPVLEAKYRLGDRKPVRMKDTKSSPAPVEEKPGPALLDEPVEPLANETEVLFSLSSRFGVPVDRLRYLRNIQTGYNDLVRALIIARDAQVEPGRPLKSRLDGSSWDKIADEFFVNGAAVDNEAKRLLEPIRDTLPSEALTERPETWQDKKQ